MDITEKTEDMMTKLADFLELCYEITTFVTHPDLFYKLAVVLNIVLSEMLTHNTHDLRWLKCSLVIVLAAV